MKKYYFIALSFLILPGFVSAETSWALKMENGKFQIQGSCTGEEVKIEFFAKAEGEKPEYEQDVSCKSGKFFFSEDLIKEDLPVGNYVVAVDGQKSLDVVSVARNKNIKSENSDSAEKKNDKKQEEEFFAEESSDPDTKFLKAFLALQQSLLDMRNWLAQTTYPKFVKKGIDSGLDGVDEIIGKIEEALWSKEENEESKENFPSENISGSSIPDQEVNLPQIIENKDNVGSVEEILSADGLDVTKKDENLKLAE